MRYTCKISSQVDEDHWNDLIGKSPQTTIFQTVRWARFMKEFLHATPYYITALEGTEPVGFAFMIKECRYSRYIRRRPMWQVAVPLMKLAAPFYRMEYGPIVLERYKDHGAEILNAIVRSIESIAKMRPFGVIEITPPVIGNSLRDEYMICLLEHGFSLQNHATFVIDLSKDLDELWEGLKKPVRKNIRRTGKKGVEVEIRNDEEAVRIYAQLLEEEKKRQGRRVPFSNLYENISIKTKYLSKDQFAILLAKHNDRYISGISILAFNGIISEMAVANTSYALENKIYAQDVLKWKIMEWGNKNNQKYYDLTGVSPSPKTEKEEGVYRFKEKWGGEFIKYGIYKKGLS